MDIYVASAMPTDYPLKLQKPSTISKRVVDSTDTVIMDSGIGDDVSNTEVLELATEYKADYVVAKDYLHDQTKTTDSIAKFRDLYADKETDATPLIPLQPPFIKHYEQLEARGLDTFSHYVLGGMAIGEVDTTQQIRWIKEFHENGPDVYTHGLGVGGGMEFVSKVAGKGWLDSVDCSTPEQAAMFGQILDKRLRQKEMMAFPGGEGKSNRTHALAEFNSWQLHDVWERESQQVGLAAYGD